MNYNIFSTRGSLVSVSLSSPSLSPSLSLSLSLHLSPHLSLCLMNSCISCYSYISATTYRRDQRRRPVPTLLGRIHIRARFEQNNDYFLPPTSCSNGEVRAPIPVQSIHGGSRVTKDASDVSVPPGCAYRQWGTSLSNSLGTGEVTRCARRD